MGLYLLFGTELWERFSYYGMHTLLILYLTAQTTTGWGVEAACGRHLLAQKPIFPS